MATISEFINKVGFKVKKDDVKKVNTTISDIKDTASKILGAIGVGISLTAINGLVEEFSLVNQQVRNATSALGEQTDIQQKILAAAKATRSTYQQTASVVSNLVQENSELFGTIDKAIAFNNAATMLFKTAGKTNDEIAGLMEAINKSFAKGYVDSETLSQLLERSPEAVKLLCAELGTTQDQLEQLASDGKFTVENLYNAFVNNAGAISSAFGNVKMTVTEAITVVRNQWGLWLAETNEMLGLTDTIGKVIIAVSDGAVRVLTKVRTGVMWLSEKLGGTENLLKLVAITAGAIFLAMNFSKIMSGLQSVGKLLTGINLKTLAIVAAIVLVALLVEDFINFMQGNNSLLGEMLERAGVDCDALRETIIGAWEQIKAKLAVVWEHLKVAGTKVWDAIKKMAESIGNGLKAFWAKWGDEITATFGVIWDQFKIIFDALLDILIGVADFIGAVFSGDWEAAWQAVKDIFVAAWEAISAALVAVWEHIKLLVQIGLDFLKGLFENAWNGIKSVTETVWNAIKSFFVGIWENIKSAISGAIDSVKSSISNAWENVKSNTSSAWEKVTSTIGGAWDKIKSGASSGWDKIKGVWSPVADWFDQNVIQPVINFFQNIWSGITDAFQNVIDWVKSNWKSIVAFIINPFAGVFQYLYDNFEGFREFVDGVLQTLKEFFVKTWEEIKSTTIAVWEAIKSFFSKVWNGIKSTVSNAVNAVKTAVSNAWDKIKSATTAAWEKVKSTISGIWDKIKSLISSAINTVKTTVSNAWDKIKSTTTAAWDKVKSTITGAWDKIKSGVSSAIDKVKSTISSVWDSIKSTTSSVWNTIKSTVTSVVDNIKSSVKNGFETLKSNVKTIWENIKSAITTPINNAWDAVKKVVDKLKSAFDFEWSLPKLKLPHITVTGGVAPYGIGGKGSLPKFNIEWYKEGGILDGAQIFGAMGGKLLGGGEAGKEAVLPLSELWRQMRSMINDGVNKLVAFAAPLMGMESVSTSTVSTVTNSSVNRTVVQNVNFHNEFHGERAAQQRTSTTMKQAASDTTGELARALAFAK